MCPALGPLVTEKLTAALARPLPAPSESVAISVTDAPTDFVAAPGVRFSVAALEPVAPIGRQAIDSFFDAPVPQKPASMPPVSRTWLLSRSFVATPPTGTVTVGMTVIGVQTDRKSTRLNS